MTTLFEQEFECSICGEKSDHIVVVSTNSIGSPDLDTRPPEMERSTLCHRIQRCPKCGYCSPDLSECGDKTKELVNSKEYQNIIGNCEMPEIAASFLALSHENEQHQEYSDSAWRAIQAAWICDDENNLESSKKCREQAVSLLEKAQANGQKFGDQAGASEAITIDLMRRSGMHQAALELSAAMKVKDIDELILQVIQYEEDLIAKDDTAVHTISEALGE